MVLSDLYWYLSVESGVRSNKKRLREWVDHQIRPAIKVLSYFLINITILSMLVQVLIFIEIEIEIYCCGKLKKLILKHFARCLKNTEYILYYFLSLNLLVGVRNTILQS